MVFNKKYIAMMLSMVVVSQVGAMKRRLELTSSTDSSQHKTMKISHGISGIAADRAQFVIPSGWSEQSIDGGYKNPRDIVVADQRGQLNNLKVSPEEQLPLKRFGVSYYLTAHSKLDSALAKKDFNETDRHAQKLLQLEGYSVPVVAQIVSSPFSNQEKIKLFDRLEKIKTGELLKKSINEQNMIGQSPLRLAVLYDNNGSNYNLAHALLSRGASPDDCDEDGRPVSFDAHSVEMLKLLRSFRPLEETDQPFVKVDRFYQQTDNAGRTLLFENATNDPKDIEIATLYIAEGGSIDHKNNAGETAYDEQLSQGNANYDLAFNDYAREMTRENLGINPYSLRNIQTGQVKLKRF